MLEKLCTSSTIEKSGRSPRISPSMIIGIVKVYHLGGKEIKQSINSNRIRKSMYSICLANFCTAKGKNQPTRISQQKSQINKYQHTTPNNNWPGRTLLSTSNQLNSSIAPRWPFLSSMSTLSTIKTPLLKFYQSLWQNQGYRQDAIDFRPLW